MRDHDDGLSGVNTPPQSGKVKLEELSETLVRGLPLSKHLTLECSELLALGRQGKWPGILFFQILTT